jgi:NTE family protein
MKNLVFEGGGIVGLAYIGAIESLENHNLNHGFNKFAGTSIGSIFALLVNLGYSSFEMKSLLKDIDLNKFKDESIGILSDAARLFTELGWYKGNALEKFISNIVTNKGLSSDITFSDLYFITKKTLNVVSYNLDKKEPKIFNYIDTPNVSVVQAVKSSSSIPVLFTPTVIDGDRYVDGFLADNFPISVFDEFDEKETIGFMLKSGNQNNFIGVGKTILESIVLKEDAHIITKENEKKAVIIYPPEDINMTDFDLSDNVQDRLIESGKIATDKHIEKFGLFYTKTKIEKINKRKKVFTSNLIKKKDKDKD